MFELILTVRTVLHMTLDLPYLTLFRPGLGLPSENPQPRRVDALSPTHLRDTQPHSLPPTSIIHAALTTSIQGSHLLLKPYDSIINSSMLCQVKMRIRLLTRPSKRVKPEVS